MFDETESKSKWVNKLNTAAWSCCSKRLFCVIRCFIISICDAVSQFTGGARRYHLNYHYLPIKVTIKYKKQHQILLSLSKMESNKSGIYQSDFQVNLSVLLMNQLFNVIFQLKKILLQMIVIYKKSQKVLIGIVNVLFLEPILCIVLVS